MRKQDLVARCSAGSAAHKFSLLGKRRPVPSRRQITFLSCSPENCNGAFYRMPDCVLRKLLVRSHGHSSHTNSNTYSLPIFCFCLHEQGCQRVYSHWDRIGSWLSACIFYNNLGINIDLVQILNKFIRVWGCVGNVKRFADHT